MANSDQSVPPPITLCLISPSFPPNSSFTLKRALQLLNNPIIVYSSPTRFALIDNSHHIAHLSTQVYHPNHLVVN
ncbi:hypothetical protein NLI96_g12917 [Meripilus lineatus]|uniref:Uncharacterized protein n=1 Tax=Meripilus lineatus TaxID=2056292 RepID=A0AAD5USW8_9APHY|nr:hypothetical protein NLI96_g12917 [Physisporinus lineatus]